jgi:hypothetical protein
MGTCDGCFSLEGIVACKKLENHKITKELKNKLIIQQKIEL